MDATISLVVQQTMNDIIDTIENDHSPPPHHRPITDTIKQKIDELISEGRYSRGFMDESCERCGFDSHIISNRCGGNREFLSVQDIKSPEGAELICRSCTIDSRENTKWCEDCGVSNKITDDFGRDMSDTGVDSDNFWRCYHCCLQEIEDDAKYLAMEVHHDDEDPNPYSLPKIFCGQCGSEENEHCIHHLYQFEAQREESMTCESCNRVWDGNAQCPCGIGYVFDTDPYEEEYEEEYEIDEDPPENNSERANGMKQTIKNLGEIVYDIQDKILEGEYLQMMNLLQKITNQINLL